MAELMDNFGIICMAIKNGGSNGLSGRTKLQKMTYFARKLGWDLDPYRLHFYGPYSMEIAESLQLAKGVGLVTEDSSGRGPYTYSLSEDGMQFLAKFLDRLDSGMADVTGKLFSTLSGYKREQLELAATIDYVQDCGPASSRQETVDEVSDIKDNFESEDIEKAYDIWLAISREIKRLAPAGN